MKAGVIALVASIAAVVAAWWWLGAPVDVGRGGLAAGERLECVSYAPFRETRHRSTWRCTSTQSRSRTIWRR